MGRLQQAQDATCRDVMLGRQLRQFLRRSPLPVELRSSAHNFLHLLWPPHRGRVGTEWPAVPHPSEATPTLEGSVPPSSSVLPGLKPLVTHACDSTRRLGPSPQCGFSPQVGVRRGLRSASWLRGCRLRGVSGLWLYPRLPSGSLFRTPGGHENSSTGTAPCSRESL